MPLRSRISRVDGLPVEFTRPLTDKPAPLHLDLVHRGLFRLLDIVFICTLSDDEFMAAQAKLVGS